MRSRLALVALLLFSRVAAQERLGFDPSLPNQQFNFDQWSGENGLVSNNLTSVLHSRTGFLWMTTYNGLMRFDGKRLEVFDRSTHPFFHTDAFYRAYEDSQGTIWIASQGTGIVRIKNDSITRFLPNNKLLPLSIRSIHFDTAAGVVWAGSNNSGLYTIRDTVVNQLRHPWLDDQTILSLHTDPKGKLWIATDGGGLVTYEKGKFERITETEGLVSNAVNAVTGFDDG
ncbi:MAG: ligand-binding sensor domain-containing protein, partial [Bacteroidota bacterium]